MIKYSVLTYIIGNYEIVREVDYDISTTPHIEYVLVTDNPKLKSNTYKVVFDEELANSEMDNWGKVLQVRYNPFKYVSNDICIRIDGSMQVCAPMDKFIEQFVKENYDGGILLPCTYTTFLLFQIFKESLSFHSAAISLDCGCKVTTFSETTKIFAIKNCNIFSFS